MEAIMNTTNTKAYEQGKARGYETQMPHATSAEWNHYRAIVPFVPGVTDYAAELAEYDRGMADGYAQWKVEHPYSVNLWGSDPDAGNDDCWTGVDFATREEAFAAFRNPWTHVNATYFRPADVAWIEVDGPDLHEKRRNPAYRPSRRTDDGWRQECAMQAGMGMGVEAYNDAMGY
jgi:hypothetical protein